MSRPITVALAADADFAMQLAVVLASLARVADDCAHEIYVLHDGYPSQLRQKVERAAGRDLVLTWIEVPPSIQADAAWLPNRLPVATLSRLRLEELLPADLDRVIYLDADTIVRHPLVPLWESHLDGALAGAVRDAWSCCTAQGLPWRELGISPNLPYFNAGVMLIALDAWRKQQVSTRAFRLASEHKFQDGDQGAINAVLVGSWKQLEPKWNVQANHFDGDDARVRAIELPDLVDQAARDPAIVHFHFSVVARPWTAGSSHPFAHQWLEILDTTDWAGWRPKKPGVGFRLARRVRRTANTLVKGNP